MFVRNRFAVLLVVIVMLLVMAVPALAQDVPPDTGGIDLGQVLYDRLDLILVVVGIGFVVVILRPVLMELARQASENIPPGAVKDILNGVILNGVLPMVYEQLDARLRDFEDAARADERTPLDEAVIAELRDMFREIKDTLTTSQKVQ